VLPVDLHDKPREKTTAIGPPHSYKSQRGESSRARIVSADALGCEPLQCDGTDSHRRNVCGCHQTLPTNHHESDTRAYVSPTNIGIAMMHTCAAPTICLDSIVLMRVSSASIRIIIVVRSPLPINSVVAAIVLLTKEIPQFSLEWFLGIYKSGSRFTQMQWASLRYGQQTCQ